MRIPRGLSQFAIPVALLSICFHDASGAETSIEAKVWREKGLSLDVGAEGAPDAIQAFAAMRRAAEAGDAEAAFNVAVMLDSGRGSTRDIAEAAIWYAISGVRGERRGAFNLAMLYEAGEGVPANIDLARSWYAAANLPAAREHLAKLPPVTNRPAHIQAPRPQFPATNSVVVDRQEVELVWTSDLQPEPVRFFVELRRFDDSNSEEFWSGFVDVTSVRLPLPADAENVAWRVSSVARRSGGYAVSAWSTFALPDTASSAIGSIALPSPRSGAQRNLSQPADRERVFLEKSRNTDEKSEEKIEGPAGKPMPEVKKLPANDLPVTTVDAPRGEAADISHDAASFDPKSPRSFEDADDFGIPPTTSNRSLARSTTVNPGAREPPRAHTARGDAKAALETQDPNPRVPDNNPDAANAKSELAMTNAREPTALAKSGGALSPAKAPAPAPKVVTPGAVAEKTAASPEPSPPSVAALPPSAKVVVDKLTPSPEPRSSAVASGQTPEASAASPNLTTSRSFLPMGAVSAAPGPTAVAASAQAEIAEKPAVPDTRSSAKAPAPALKVVTPGTVAEKTAASPEPPPPSVAALPPEAKVVVDTLTPSPEPRSSAVASGQTPEASAASPNLTTSRPLPPTGAVSAAPGPTAVAASAQAEIAEKPALPNTQPSAKAPTVQPTPAAPDTTAALPTRTPTTLSALNDTRGILTKPQQVLIVLAQPDVKSPADLRDKAVVNAGVNTLSDKQLKASFSAAGASGLLLKQGDAQDVSQLWSGQVAAVVVAVADPEVAWAFHEIPGYKLMLVQVAP